MKGRVCPILLIAKNKDVDCLCEECAWYSSPSDSCAVWAVHELTGNAGEMVRKLAKVVG